MLPFADFQLNGRVVADAEVKTALQARKKFLVVSFAQNRRYKPKDGGDVKETTHYFNDVEVWGQLAAFCTEHDILTKGQAVSVRGRIDYDSWTDTTSGKKRSRLKLVATHIDPIQTRETAGAGVTTNTGSYAEEDLPF